MYFTREPIIETIISPKEGFKLAVRNSKGVGQEEFFVDALEVVSFGSALFYRSTERPKAFLVPVSDYEVLEVRETRMALKSIPVDRGIKIAGGRDANLKSPREISDKEELLENEKMISLEADKDSTDTSKNDKKRERRRFRKRRGREEKIDTASEEVSDEESEIQEVPFLAEETKDEFSEWGEEPAEEVQEKKPTPEGRSSAGVFSSLLPPPTTLISETISRYKDTPLFAGAFYAKEEVKTTEGEIKESIQQEIVQIDEKDIVVAETDKSEEEKDDTEIPSNLDNDEGLPF